MRGSNLSLGFNESLGQYTEVFRTRTCVTAIASLPVNTYYSNKEVFKTKRFY